MAYNSECYHAIRAYSWNTFLLQEEKIKREDVYADLDHNIALLSNHALLNNYKNSLAKKSEELKKIDNEHDFIDYCSDIRFHLVNAKTIHYLIKSEHIQHGFICEGNKHIESIKNALRMLGYTPQKTIGNIDAYKYMQTDSKKEHELNRDILNQALDIQKELTAFLEEESILNKENMLQAPLMLPKPIVFSEQKTEMKNNTLLLKKGIF
jgi:hypothetical protein